MKENFKQNNENLTEQIKKYLAEKDYLYHILFDKHNLPMLLIDPDTGCILEANQAAVKYYKYTKDELLNTINIKDINVLSPEQVSREMKRARLEKRNYFEFVHLLATGEQKEVEVYSYPVKIQNKTLLFSIINDISDKMHKELMFDTLFFNSPYGVVILDRNQKIVNINKYFTHIFQYELDEAKGKHIGKLLSCPDSISQIDNNIQLVYRGEIVKQEGLRRRKDGKLICTEILAYPVINRHSIIGVYVIYSDISEKKAYEEQLLLFKKVLENNTEGVVITNAEGNIEWINNAFERITRFSFTEVKGRNMNILKSGFHGQSFYKDMWNQLIKEGTWSGEVWNKTKEGEIFCGWLKVNSIKDNSSKTTHYVGILRELSEKKKIDRRMAELKQKDILTGLYNRSYFLELVDNYIKRCKNNKRFSIIFIDIESFKEINNSLGHHIGDELLIEISSRLMNLTDNNCILSRYSGDEFAVLCKSFVDGQDIKSIAEKFINSIEHPFVKDNMVLNIRVNIGVSCFPNDGQDAETLVRHAETAMYKTKEHINERISLYRKEMSQEIEEQFILANLLSRAISNEELSIYYQPIFNIKNPLEVKGTEALLRWNNPDIGETHPEIFIPLAERTGHIISIGEWVLEQVCRQIRQWEQAGFDLLPVSVNISVNQLEQPEFYKKVIENIEKFNICPYNIEMEITESVSSGNLKTITNNLKELKKYGVRISMDDFGTGFSSLGQIDMFELDKLKIDKYFINDLLKVTKKQNLVKSIIAMARSLNLKVVAEGIETIDQLIYLKEFGCHFGQGFLLSRPLPPKKIEALFGTRQIISKRFCAEIKK